MRNECGKKGVEIREVNRLHCLGMSLVGVISCYLGK